MRSGVPKTARARLREHAINVDCGSDGSHLAGSPLVRVP